MWAPFPLLHTYFIHVNVYYDMCTLYPISLGRTILLADIFRIADICDKSSKRCQTPCTGPGTQPSEMFTEADAKSFKVSHHHSLSPFILYLENTIQGA